MAKVVKKNLNIYLTKEESDAVKEFAANKGISTSSLFRVWIHQLIMKDEFYVSTPDFSVQSSNSKNNPN